MTTRGGRFFSTHEIISGSRADEVSLGQHVRRAFRVRDDADTGMVCAVLAQLLAREALVHHCSCLPRG